jgi:predicted GH43/DUF377 family glycosyl hydrolase
VRHHLRVLYTNGYRVVKGEPLVRPDPTERAGYVPNVVYTCGGMRHGDRIILPYAISDTYSNFANIKIAALLRAMES